MFGLVAVGRQHLRDVTVELAALVVHAKKWYQLSDC